MRRDDEGIVRSIDPRFCRGERTLDWDNTDAALPQPRRCSLEDTNIANPLTRSVSPQTSPPSRVVFAQRFGLGFHYETEILALSAGGVSQGVGGPLALRFTRQNPISGNPHGGASPNR